MKMKIKTIIVLLVCTIATMISPGCELDNYDPPEVMLTGNIVYSGTALNLGSEEVTLQLWEQGWQLKIPIVVNVDVDGSYSAKLFNGNYKMVVPAGQGPFVTVADTIPVNLSGSMTKDIEVTPYYLVSSPSISASGGTISATFGANKVTATSSIQSVYLYVNHTIFCDRGNNLASASLAGGSIVDENSIALNVAVPTLVREQNYIFARLAIQISGVEDYIYSEVVKLTI
jgi:hypothetical protein